MCLCAYAFWPMQHHLCFDLICMRFGIETIGKHGPEKTLYLDAFHTVSYFCFKNFTKMMEISFHSMVNRIAGLKFFTVPFSLPGLYNENNDPLSVSSIWWLLRTWFNDSWINTWISSGKYSTSSTKILTNPAAVLLLNFKVVYLTFSVIIVLSRFFCDPINGINNSRLPLINDIWSGPFIFCKRVFRICYVSASLQFWTF